MRRKQFLLLLVVLLLAFTTNTITAGGPKCDKNDSEKCSKCEGMNHMNCKNRCHAGCCGCPDGSDPIEGKCSRDENQGEDPGPELAHLRTSGLQCARGVHGTRCTNRYAGARALPELR